MNVYKFISEVKKRPALWDYTSKSYNNKSKLGEGWKDIAKTFNIEVPLAKQKWKNLRDTYRVELKKTKKYTNVENSGSRTTKSLWAYYEHMSFIRYFIRTRKLSAKIIPEDNEEVGEGLNESVKMEPEITMSPIMISEDNDAQNDDSNANFTIESVTSLQPDCGDVDTTQDGRGTKRKYEDHHHEDDDQDDNILFFRSLLPFVRKLDQDKKLLFRMKVQQMLYEQLYN